ncbi:hypothetical protein PR048_027674 [Dryococelus australis]|uniref:RNA-directed DNA polymerase n=1 Tax=Dryococelus australis TaxID=614101 RepID=A0ABQ9GH53_9NEOP|nr:hypothetical protein PR048_027674 [Dryococelus australis]
MEVYAYALNIKWGSTEEECQHNLIACLDQLQKFDLHLNQQKCSFFQEQIEYLGHVIEFNKILKSLGNVAAIVDMPRPKSIEDVRRFLGMVTYYSRFIHGTSTITTPLRHFLSTFLKLKQAIASDQVFIPYDPDLPVQLACDAIPTGIARVLSHIVDGHEHPIAFTSSEQNYSQVDREALAIVFTYLFGRHFKLITDNHPLTRIFNHRAALPKMTAGCLQCYAAFLSGFNYTIDFKKGIENTPININIYTASTINNEVKQLCDTTIEQISIPTVIYQLLKEVMKNNDTLSSIMNSLQEEYTSEPDCIIESGILFRGQRVVSASLQSAVLHELHRTHVDITKMNQLPLRYVYWKKIDSDIEHIVRSCSECVAIKNRRAKAPSHPWEGNITGNKFITIMPALTKTIIFWNGFPEVMVSENAMIFTSENLHNSEFCVARYPTTNSLAECNVQMQKHRLATISNQNMLIHQKNWKILFRYQATPLSNGKSPAEQYLNRQIRIQLDSMRPIKFHESPAPTQSVPRYYSNNKAHWKCGNILKKLGKLHHLLELDNGFHKRHIDQLRSTEVLLPARKTVHFDPQPKSPTSDDRQLNKSNLGDLTEIMDPDVVLPEEEQPDPIEQGEVPVIDFQLPEQSAQRERPQRERRLPAYPRDYSLY